MWFDLLILGILLFTTLRGAVKGMVWQLAAIASLVLCFVFAQSGSKILSPMIPLQAPANRWTAMFIIYLVSSLIAFGTARALREAIEKAKFTEYDRHLGAIFGFLKGSVISLVLIFFVVTVSDSLRATVMNTRSGRAAAVVMDRLHDVLPEDLLEKLEPYIHNLDRPGLDLRYGDDNHERHRHDDEYARDGRGDDPFNRPDSADPFGSHRNGSRPGEWTPEPNRPIDRGPFDEPPRRDPRDTRNVPPPANDPFAGRPPRDRNEPDLFGSDPGPSRRSPADQEEIDFIGEIKKKLSGAFEKELEERVRRAFRNTAPEDRRDLSDEFSRARPDSIPTLADDWRSGRPSRRGTSRDPLGRSTRDPLDRGLPDPLGRDARDPLPRGGTTASRDDRDRLMAQVVEFYSDTRAGRQAAQEDFEEHLDGVPDRVATAVLRDWLFDLSAVDRKGDPDPATHHNTKLDVRILNQLKAARVPLSSLDEALQDRLRDSERR